MFDPEDPIRTAVIVAHPDDETLWAGGLILSRPRWRFWILSLCRGSDPDRAPRFRRAVASLGAQGVMGDLDDGPDQNPLPIEEVRAAILAHLPQGGFDLVLTHGIRGEYTRHLRHEEVSRAVIDLWDSGEIRTRTLWTFAYEDGGREYAPRPTADADRTESLPENLWKEKVRIVKDIYGFAAGSFEAEAAGPVEAFNCFTSAGEALAWARRKGIEP